MTLLKKILHKLNGLHYPQEYLCLSGTSSTHPLYAYIVNNDRIIKDITNLHLFVGYNPLIFAFSSVEKPGFSSTLQIIFSQQFLSPNDILSKKDALAIIQFKLVKKQEISNEVIFYFEGIYGIHHFLSPFHQFISSINNRLYNKKQATFFCKITYTGRYRSLMQFQEIFR